MKFDFRRAISVKYFSTMLYNFEIDTLMVNSKKAFKDLSFCGGRSITTMLSSCNSDMLLHAVIAFRPRPWPM